jgi:hypothetical protein
MSAKPTTRELQSVSLCTCLFPRRDPQISSITLSARDEGVLSRESALITGQSVRRPSLCRHGRGNARDRQTAHRAKRPLLRVLIASGSRRRRFAFWRRVDPSFALAMTSHGTAGSGGGVAVGACRTRIVLRRSPKLPWPGSACNRDANNVVSRSTSPVCAAAACANDGVPHRSAPSSRTSRVAKSPGYSA